MTQYLIIAIVILTGALAAGGKYLSNVLEEKGAAESALQASSDALARAAFETADYIEVVEALSESYQKARAERDKRTSDVMQADFSKMSDDDLESSVNLASQRMWDDLRAASIGANTKATADQTGAAKPSTR